MSEYHQTKKFECEEKQITWINTNIYFTILWYVLKNDLNLY